MNQPITVLVPIKLAPGRTEEELLAASEVFQREFAGKEQGLLRRELVRLADGEYLDIVQFRSRADADDIVAREMESPECAAFFSLMVFEEDEELGYHSSLATYTN